jgi:hypothetical protein
MTAKRFVALGLSMLLVLIAHEARATDRFVFDRFLGANLVSGTPAVDPLRVYNVPRGVAIDGNGRFYVADPLGNRVLVFDPSLTPPVTSIITFPSASVTMNKPMAVAIDPRNNDLWIANTGARQLVKLTTSTIPFTLLQVFGAHGTNDGQFESPAHVAVDSMGNVYVGDDGGVSLAATNISADNIRVQKFTSSGAFITKWGSLCNLTTGAGSCNRNAPGAFSVGDGQFSPVSGIAIDSMDNVYVSEEGNHRVQQFASDGTWLLKWGTQGSAPGQFDHPLGLAIDYADNVYVADFRNNRIQKFTTTGIFLSQFGSAGGSIGNFAGPWAIAANPKLLTEFCLALGAAPHCNTIWVSEKTNSRVQGLEALADTDNDGIVDDVDQLSGIASTIAARGDSRLSVVSPGSAPAVVAGPQVGLPNPNGAGTVAPDTLRFETGSAPSGGTPWSFEGSCNGSAPFVTLSAPATGDASLDFHCSTPTVTVWAGPFDFAYSAPDGTSVTASLASGDSLTVDTATNAIKSNAGTLALTVGGVNVSLAPGQSTFADSTPPVTTATPSPAPNANGWSKSNVVVTLNATDLGGAGVQDIHYSLTGAQTGSGLVNGGVATVPISTDGVTMLTYYARDNAGNQEAAKTLTVRIDTIGPTLVGMPGPGCTLWPPDRRLVQVASISAGASPSGLVPGSFTVTATSNEPATGSPDVVVTGGAVQLRAERAGSGSGRIYTITAQVTDLAGNVATSTETCSVPHDPR